MIEQIGQWKLNRHTGNTYLRSAMLSLQSASDWQRLSSRERQAIRDEDYVYAQVLGKYGGQIIPFEAKVLHKNRKKGIPAVVRDVADPADIRLELAKAEKVQIGPDVYRRILYGNEDVSDIYLEDRENFGPDDKVLSKEERPNYDDEDYGYEEEDEDIDTSNITFDRYKRDLGLGLENQRQVDSLSSGRHYTAPLHERSERRFFLNMKEIMEQYVRNLPSSKLFGRSRSDMVKLMIDTMVDLMQQGLLSPSEEFFSSDGNGGPGEFEYDGDNAPKTVRQVYSYLELMNARGELD